MILKDILIVYHLLKNLKQLPDNAKVMVEDKITDERGTRFLFSRKYE